MNEHNSWSESVYSQDGLTSDGLPTPASEPPSDRTSLMCSSLDLHSNDSPDHEGSVCIEPLSTDASLMQNFLEKTQIQDHESSESSLSKEADTEPSCPTSICLQDTACQVDNDPAKAVESKEQTTSTPDVDMLLECTFSYMHAANEKPDLEEPAELHNPELQPKDDLERNFELDLPSYPIRPLPYSPEPEPEQSPSSDEEDIYTHAVPSSASLGDGLSSMGLQSSTMKQTEQEDLRLHKTDQVRVDPVCARARTQRILINYDFIGFIRKAIGSHFSSALAFHFVMFTVQSKIMLITLEILAEVMSFLCLT